MEAKKGLVEDHEAIKRARIVPKKGKKVFLSKYRIGKPQ